MKNLILFLLLTHTFFEGIAQDPNSKEVTKNDLTEFIKKAQMEGRINENALIVIDEELILDVKDLSDDQKFYGEIGLINSGNQDMVEIYGENAINGIIMISSPPETPDGYDVEISKEIVLFFIGSREVSEAELKKLNPDSILNIQVVKSQDEIKKLTSKKCDGLVIINLKNK